MRLSGEQRVAASRDIVWKALNDPHVLRRTIPGCTRLETIDDGELAADVTTTVGPVRAKFSGKVRLSQIDPSNGLRIAGEGQGGPAGFANGAATVSLVASGEDTVIKYDVEAAVGGKLAQIGSRLVDAAARRMADDFFTEFGRIVSISRTANLEPATAAEVVAQRSVSPAVWVPTLIVMMGFFALLFA